ncbi:MAG: hypothetical protein P4M09_14555 [Devosia sp.]|nr:hypothetical protein [Devosia sp.]
MGKYVTLKHLRPVALSIVALLAGAPAALAVDANDFAAKIKGVYTSAMGPAVTLTLGAATASGNDVIIDGATLSEPAAPENVYKLDSKLTFSGVTQQADGSYLADTLTLPDVDYKFDGGELTVKDIVLKHIYVPNRKAPDVLDTTRLVGDVSVGPIVLAMDNSPAFTIAGVTISNSFKPSQSDTNLAEIDSNGLTNGIRFDLSAAKDPDTLAQAKALDLMTLTGKVLETLTWTLKDGHVNLSEFSSDFDKVGKLKFAFDLTGYTPEFLKNLSAVTQSLGELGASDGSANQQQATAMLLNSLQSLFLNSASLRFDDASITTKLLDFGAKQAGVTRDAFINQLVAEMPGQMNESGSEQVPVQMVQTMQATARAFLTNPHSVEVRLAPKAPLGVLGIVAAAMAPMNLADQIGLKILVNDKEITPDDAAKETGVAPPTANDNAAPTDNGADQTQAPADNSSTDNSGAADQTGTDATSTDRLTSKHTQ